MKRRKRVWTVSDFAAHTGIKRRPARRLLCRLNEKHGGKLFLGDGDRRGYEFLSSTLARLEPDYFESIETLEARVEALEDMLQEILDKQRIIIAQTAQNTRDIAKLRQRR